MPRKYAQCGGSMLMVRVRHGPETTDNALAPKAAHLAVPSAVNAYVLELDITTAVLSTMLLALTPPLSTHLSLT